MTTAHILLNEKICAVLYRCLGDIKYIPHDLRHSYAVVSLESGDDIKTVQSNLGHATASFTLDVYGHVSQRMKQQSADRMEAFIQKATQTA